MVRLKHNEVDDDDEDLLVEPFMKIYLFIKQYPKQILLNSTTCSFSLSFRVQKNDYNCKYNEINALQYYVHKKRKFVVGSLT
jgi:hypothetical protein